MNYPLTYSWFEAHFFNKANENGGYHVGHPAHDVAFSEAQGLCLWCPCGIDEKDDQGNLRYPLDLSLNKGRPHLCMVVFRNPPSGIVPPENFGPESRDGKSHPRWQIVSGSTLDDLTLDPSIAVGDPECWHGYIKQGMVS